MLAAGLCQTMDWKKAGYPLKGVSVNVSALQFNRSDFVDTVDEVLRETGLEPKTLELELTESLVIRDVRESRLSKLEKAAGARSADLSVDDFGAGGTRRSATCSGCRSIC